MKFKWRKWLYLFTITSLIISSFSLMSLAIYHFTQKQMNQPVASNQLLSPPIFNQSEINQMTTSTGIKVEYFKNLINQKTPAQINHFYVNDQNSSWMIKVGYSWSNQNGFWIYELKYD